MKLTLHGAAGGEVTGSAYHVETREASVLVDFGLFQGSAAAQKLNRVPKSLAPRKVQALVLTHGHLDHTGRLPLLPKSGFRGPIHTTPASAEMSGLILRDAAHLQEADAERFNRRRERAGQKPAAPLFTTDDVAVLDSLYRPLEYDRYQGVAPGVTVRLADAGHMLGSASIEMVVEEDGKKQTIVFSGDVGPLGAAVLRDPTRFRHADLVVLESTYGDRDHKPLPETLAELETIMKEAVARQGKVLVPAFAIGRTQQIMYHLAGLFRGGVIPPIPVYIDSPMALEATRIYAKHTALFDDEAKSLVQSGQFHRDLSTFHSCPSVDDSRTLNDAKGPCVIIAGAGMCNGGRILHHLKHNLWRPEAVVLIVGFQSQGSLGRMLVDGQKVVTIHGEKVAVRAAVRTLGGFSAHAGQSDLVRWIEPLAPAQPRVLLTHGEDRARQPLARLLQERFKLRVELPALEETVVLPP